MRHPRKHPAAYALVLCLALAAGLGPTVFNFVVDPYDRNGWFDLGIEKASLSEKAHYPLWKMLRYGAQTPRLIVLGDSRARALRDKYWHEAGRTDAFNFAYGGATVQEIHETFEYVKANPDIDTLIVGIQLRSFDLDHKDGMNRVPEAIELTEAAFDYYTSWFVAKIGWRHILAELEIDPATWALTWPRLIGTAQAADRGASDRLTLFDLLSPEACLGCELPEVQQTAFAVGPGVNLGLGRGYGEWSRLWPAIELDRELPAKFARQVERNARSDWRSFNFSEELWSKLNEISVWSRENNVELVFVIPPTISEMQERITEFGFGILNHDFRLRLAELAPVVDFDFDNVLTRDISRFSDAYHFNAAASREIVGELVMFTGTEEVMQNRLRDKRGFLRCPVFRDDATDRLSDGRVVMKEGMGCRIWSKEGATHDIR